MCRKGICCSQADHLNVIHRHWILADRQLIDNILTQLVSWPLRQRSKLKHSVDELQHPPYRSSSLFHLHIQCFFLTHLHRPSASHKLSLCITSQTKSPSAAVVLFFLFCFFPLDFLLISLHHFYFSSSLTSHYCT